jgi:dienelactone hydrolase
VEDRIAYEWIRPEPLADDAPVVLFIHGGLVPADRYRWIGIHLASRGYAVAAPTHSLDLAIFESGNALAVLDDIERRRPRVPTAAAGHSLGGVIADWAFQDDPRVGAAALFASFPAGSGPVPQPGPVLSLSGTTDESAFPDEVQAGAERYPEARLHFVEGLNHYGWTDGATEGELSGDGPLERPLDELREDALRVFDAWLDASLRDDPEARARLDLPFPGVVQEAP